MIATVPDSVRSRELIVYELKVYPEFVYGYYKERLGGDEQFDKADFDYTRLAPGATTIVMRSTNYHFGLDAKKRAVFGTRPPLQHGDWLDIGAFLWTTKEPNGDVSNYMLSVRDAGVAPDWSSYTPRTRIVMMRTTYVVPVKSP